MIRIYAQQLREGFSVYVSRVNIDPAEPALPISDPPSYSRELARATGRFYTQGVAQDTAALRQGIFARDEYLTQSGEVSLQILKLLRFELERFREGLLFFHFFGVDQNSHILWGLDERKLLETYQLVDETLGWVLECAAGATVLIVSDHGFARFDRAVHVNAWLREAGLLVLKPEADDKQEASLEDIDWSRTKAYALGLNGIYVNQQFRERDGIVAEGEETEAVLREVRDGLLVLAAPLILVYYALDGLHGRRPLAPGQPATLTVRLASPFPAEAPRLEAPAGIAVETPAVRIPVVNEVSWRIRPLGEMSGSVRIHLADETVEQPVRVGAGPLFQWPWRISGDQIRSVEIAYAEAGWGWIFWFMAISVATVLILNRRYGISL